MSSAPGSPEESKVQLCCPCEVTTRFHSNRDALRAMAVVMVQELEATHGHAL